MDVRKEKAVDNDYVGVRFNRQHPSSDNTNKFLDLGRHELVIT